MKFSDYLFSVIIGISLVLAVFVVYRLAITVLKTLFKSLEIEKKVKAFKSWLDQKPDD